MFRRGWVALGVVIAAVLAIGGIEGVAFQITHSTETLAGIQAPAQFLRHWQQVGSETAAVPAPVPAAWSVTVGTPSRLPRVSGAYRIDAATGGDQALVWVFNETVGVATSTEIEINFHIQYSVGAVSTTTTITVYIETQRRALAGTLSFTVYWDSGHAAGVTFVNQLEVAQACTAVGTCP